MSLHSARLLSQDSRPVIGVRREDERVRLFGLEDSGKMSDHSIPDGTFHGAQNETHNHTVEAECNVACLLDLVLSVCICVKELGMDGHHIVGRH